MNAGAAISTERLGQLAGRMSGWRSDMLRDLTSICTIPSVRGLATEQAPYGEKTRQVLETFLKLGQGLGFEAVNLDNRAGYVEFGQGDHLVAALCHLDVVPAGDGWTTDPFQPVIQDGRFIARGASDDKGPAIAVLYAMKDLLESGWQPRGRIRLIVGLDEEKGSSCMAHYVQVAQLPDAGFTPDAAFPVIYAEKGLCWIELSVEGGQAATDALKLVSAAGGESPNMIPGRCDLTFLSTQADPVRETRPVTGTPGHASMPWLGDNAISNAMHEACVLLDQAKSRHPFVTFFHQAIGRSWRGEGLGIAFSDESGPLTVNPGLIRLDEDQACLTVDIRYPVTLPPEQLLTQMEQRASQLGARMRLLKNIPPLYLPRDSFLVTTLSRVFASLTGMDAAPVAIGGGTYARTMPNVVAFGGCFPGDPETAHQAGEFIIIDHLLATAAIYRQALIELSA